MNSIHQSRTYIRNLLVKEERDCLEELRVTLERAANRHFVDLHTESLDAINEAIECAARLNAICTALKEA